MEQLRFTVGRPFDGLDVFLYLASGYHKFMSASLASKLKIHARPEHKHTETSAGVFFFQYKYIFRANVHKRILSYC